MKNEQDKSMAFLLKLLKEKLKELDQQLENTNQVCNEDDFKILIGNQARAEDLMHELQGAVG